MGSNCKFHPIVICPCGVGFSRMVSKPRARSMHRISPVNLAMSWHWDHSNVALTQAGLLKGLNSVVLLTPEPGVSKNKSNAKS